VPTDPEPVSERHLSASAAARVDHQKRTDEACRQGDRGLALAGRTPPEHLGAFVLDVVFTLRTRFERRA